jgi:hypothetical protein
VDLLFGVRSLCCCCCCWFACRVTKRKQLSPFYTFKYLKKQIEEQQTGRDWKGRNERKKEEELEEVFEMITSMQPNIPKFPNTPKPGEKRARRNQDTWIEERTALREVIKGIFFLFPKRNLKLFSCFDELLYFITDPYSKFLSLSCFCSLRFSKMIFEEGSRIWKIHPQCGEKKRKGR